MRNISANGLAKLAQKLGTEPICLISVDWVDTSKEFLSSSNWTSTGWTGSWSVGWQHTVGNTDVLSQSTSTANGIQYYLTYTVSGSTAGSFTISIGGQSRTGITSTGSWAPTSISTAALQITPTSDFNGKIVLSIETTKPMLYADKDVESIPGKIIELGAIDNVTNVTGSSTSQSLSVTLDDTDGVIKNIFDTHDIHLRPAKVYQYFSGLDLSDKFLLFSGTVSSPLTWNERDRTIKFSIVSRLESNEVGFSAEEGNFEFLPADLVGKVWPMVFGKVQNVPALRVPQAVTGTTLSGIGILSGIKLWQQEQLGANNAAFFDSLAMSNIQKGHLSYVASAWIGVDTAQEKAALDQANAVSNQIAQSVGNYNRQQICAEADKKRAIDLATRDGEGGNTIQVLGGEDFLQNQTVTLNINGAHFTGIFNGNLFTISSRVHPDLEAYAQYIFSLKDFSCNNPAGRSQDFNYQSNVPCGKGDNGGCTYTTKGVLVSTQVSTSHEKPTKPVAQQFWADAGSTVYVLNQEPKTYIVSTTPGTVLSVKAYKTFNGGQTLLEVPKKYYSVTTQNYGPITAVQVVLTQVLSTIFNGTLGVYEGWSDELYVTFESAIGPDIIDIIKYLITTHTELTWDDASFNHCQTKLTPFPANFAILNRKDILNVLQDIAFQSRCAIWLDDDVFKMTYLPEIPTPVDTITFSNVDAENGIEISLTPTENLNTEMIVTWRMSLAAFTSTSSPDLKMVLRHNVKKYGLMQQDYDWYLFNQPDIVYKMATFWLIRNSSTWKTVKFQTYLNKLNLEVFDAVTLDLPQVATSPVVALITKASYNSADNCIDIECALPIKAGSMVPDPFYWPADLAKTITWPTQEDINNGDAGGGQWGDVIGPLPIGDTSTITIPGESVIIVGGPNVVFTAHSSWGNRTPTDTAFTAQTIINPATYVGLSQSGRPTLFLDTRVPRSMVPINTTITDFGITIDIRKTKVIDSSDIGKVAYLSTLIKKINGSEKLVLDGDNLLVGKTSDQPEGQVFDFKFDSDGNKFGAGTAFLKD